MSECRTVSISITLPPDAVYEYLLDPSLFPQWSTFITAIKKDGIEWVATTPDSAVRMRFTERNAFRILDQHVQVNPEMQVYVPLRVLANGESESEVVFSVFRMPGMNDQQYDEDIKLVVNDLRSLKRVLEQRNGKN